MPRTSPIQKTFKRLFGLSGNICAFNDPQCNNNLIDIDGNVIGQVCHIEAASPKGERYNPQQTEDQRKDFDNLILLCSICHIITNDVQKYTVEVLKEMKRSHEEKYLGNEQYVPDEISDKLIEKYNYHYNISNNNSGNQANNFGSGIQNIHIGLTYPEAKEIALDIFKSNYIKLSEEANKIAMKKMESFTKELIDRLKNESEEIFNRLKEPHIQMSIFNAQKGYIGTGSDELRDLYLDLLVSRIKSEQQSLLQLSLEQSINILPKLTSSHINTLTLIYLMNTYKWDFNDFQELKLFFIDKIIPLLSKISSSRIDYRYLEHTGCIDFNVIGSNFVDFVNENCIKIFTTSFVTNDIWSSIRPYDATIVSHYINDFIPNFVDKNPDQTYNFKNISLNSVNIGSKDFEANENLYDYFKQLFDKVKFKQYKIKEHLISISPLISELHDIWNNTLLGNFDLNTIGEVIAISNYNTYEVNKIRLEDIFEKKGE